MKREDTVLLRLRKTGPKVRGDDDDDSDDDGSMPHAWTIGSWRRTVIAKVTRQKQAQGRYYQYRYKVLRYVWGPGEPKNTVSIQSIDINTCIE